MQCTPERRKNQCHSGQCTLNITILSVAYLSSRNRDKSIRLKITERYCSGFSFRILLGFVLLEFAGFELCLLDLLHVGFELRLLGFSFGTLLRLMLLAFTSFDLRVVAT